MHFANEMFDHFFRNIEICNHPIPHRTDRLNGTRGAAQHQLGILAKGQCLFHAVLDLISHHGGFVKNNALATHIDQRVCGAQINRHIGSE